MHQLLFKNRFNALLFVAIILFGVRILVGTDNERGALDKASAQFGADPQVDASSRQANSAARAVATGFTPDEELIDDTTGQDPEDWSSEPEPVQGPGPETVEVQPDEQEG